MDKGKKALWKRIGVIATCAIVFRLVVYLISYRIQLNIQDGKVVDFTTFLSYWDRWDSRHYMSIALVGYIGYIEKGQHLTLVFFPLFSYLMRFVNVVIHNIRLSGLIVSTITYCIGCCYTYFLVEIDYGKKVAKNVVILVSVFPFAFFFGGIMTEGTFFMLSVAMLYYVRKHKWLIAAIIGGFVTMTRVQGLLLAIPVIIEIWQEYKPLEMIRMKKFTRMKAMIGTLCMFLFMSFGLLVYLYQNWRTEGDPFRFLVYQREHWGQHFCFTYDTLHTLWDNMMSNAYTVEIKYYMWIPQFVLFFLCVIVLLLGIKKVRAMYIGYGLAYVLMTYSVSWLLSGGRYLSCCLPVFVILGVLTQKHKWLFVGIVSIFAVFFFIFLKGYMEYQQIM